jgi:2-polyprenyl-3-methyl-5-hydroxy-6-metoxy-1,4-benzoquinol methylase
MSNKFQLIKNNQYGFLQVIPTPTSEEIIQYYKNEFYSSSYKNMNNSSLEYQEKDKEFNDTHREALFDNLCELMAKKSLAGLSLFDMGCGWGHHLSFFKQKGVIGFGFDPCDEAIAYCNNIGLDVIKHSGMELNSIEIDQKFDIVTLMNVLEHVADPIKTIMDIKDRFINENGILVIEVPNDFSFMQNAAKKMLELPEWWVQPPAHLNYFNKENLTLLLNKLGFDVIMSNASFPLEIFLLFNDNYIGNPTIGRECHNRRVNFEKNLINSGYKKELRLLYKSFAAQGIGRTIQLFARKSTL